MNNIDIRLTITIKPSNIIVVIILTAILVFLKVNNKIDWDWFWVICPIWIDFIILFLIMIVLFIISIINLIYDWRKNKW